jgi:hypothetical protein
VSLPTSPKPPCSPGALTSRTGAAASAAEAARLIDRDHHRGLAALAAGYAALAAGDHDVATEQAREALRLLGGHGHRLLEAGASALLGRALTAADRSAAIRQLEHAASKRWSPLRLRA